MTAVLPSGAADRLAARLSDWDSLPPIARMPSAMRAAVVAALLPVVERLARDTAADLLDAHGFTSGCEDSDA